MVCWQAEKGLPLLHPFCLNSQFLIGSGFENKYFKGFNFFFLSPRISNVHCSTFMSEVAGNTWQSPTNMGQENSRSLGIQTPEPPAKNDSGIWATITSNPYFSAGFGLIGVGAGLTVLRQGLNLGTSLLRRRLLVTLEIPSKDKSYLWFLQWMSQQSARRTQHLAVETTYKQHDNGSVSTTFGLVPGPGNHFFKWRGVWLQVSS